MPLGIQLSHAGRKAASAAPGDGVSVFSPGDPRAWPVVAPSPLPLVQGDMAPHELTETDIDDIVFAFASSARRAADIGFNVVELHGAHGFLMHQFLSPITNLRTDAYGGSIENRMRFTLRVFDAVKAAVKDDMAVGIRISATDWIDGGWDVSQSIVLSKTLESRGCAYVHVSGGGLDPARQVLPPLNPGFQLPYAAAIKRAVDMPVIAWYPPINFLTMDEQWKEIGINGQKHSTENSFESFLMRKQITEVDKKIMDTTNPENYISADDPPFLIQHGYLDDTIPRLQSQLFAVRLAKSIGSDNVEYNLLMGAHHAEDLYFHTTNNLERNYQFLARHIH